MITNPQELNRFLATPDIDVEALVVAGEDFVYVSWWYIADEKVPNLRLTNEVIGAYVTAGKRIHLYYCLDRLKQMALYCDTDSVIYIQPDDQPSLIETGDCLGAMTSELKPVRHIEEFISGEPRNYAYRIVNPKSGESETVCKVRGITQNYSASKLANFDVIRYMILRGDECDRVMLHTENKIKRKRAGGRIDLITEPEVKMYRLADNTSVPFGYKNER
jgi:hypothetical protein